MKMRYPNIVEFQVSGDYALFSDPLTRVGGEKFSYQVPTYESLKGIMASVYWKPTLIWVIDKVRVMKPIQTEVKGINRPELKHDRIENKHHEIAKRSIIKGGRRDIFLGTRECQGYVEPCVFGTGTGAYDDINELGFGLMYHGITYADEAYSPETENHMTANFWYPVMKNGIIDFLPPEKCPIHKVLREMPIKTFNSTSNFIGLKEFEEVT